MSRFNVGDYVMFGGREVKITGQLGEADVYYIEWRDRDAGWQWNYVGADQLSPVPDLLVTLEGSRPLRERYEDALEVVRKQAVKIEELEREIEALKSGCR